MDKYLLTPAEAAEFLGISRSRIYELIASEKLGSVTIGRSRRISRQSLDEFLEQLKTPEKV